MLAHGSERPIFWAPFPDRSRRRARGRGRPPTLRPRPSHRVFLLLQGPRALLPPSEAVRPGGASGVRGAVLEPVYPRRHAGLPAPARLPLGPSPAPPPRRGRDLARPRPPRSARRHRLPPPGAGARLAPPRRDRGRVHVRARRAPALLPEPLRVPGGRGVGTGSRPRPPPPPR